MKLSPPEAIREEHITEGFDCGVVNRPAIIGGQKVWIRQLCPTRLFGDDMPPPILPAERNLWNAISDAG